MFEESVLFFGCLEIYFKKLVNISNYYHDIKMFEESGLMFLGAWK